MVFCTEEHDVPVETLVPQRFCRLRARKAAADDDEHGWCRHLYSFGDVTRSRSSESNDTRTNAAANRAVRRGASCSSPSASDGRPKSRAAARARASKYGRTQ